MKIHVGIQNSRIETDNPKLLQALYELYSFKIPGAEYSAAYKRRQWDGKTHFISKSGVFKSGLLSRLLVDLKKIDCEPEVEYEHSITSEWYHHTIISIDKFKYYKYQEELINQGLSNLRGIIKSPTGSGKTLIMAGLIKALGRRNRKMVILFNAKQLLTQTYDFLTETCGLSDIGLCFGEGYIYGDIMLCTVQSIEKILDTHLEETEVLMVDECHEFSKGKTTLAALNSFPKAVYRLGFTATPPREPVSRYNLEGALGSVLEVVDTADLVDSGKLTKPLIQLIDRPYDASGLDEDMGYLNVYEDYIVNNESRNNIIKDIVQEVLDKKDKKKARILILTNSLSHGKALNDLIGGNCEFLQGCDSIGDRYEAISRFKKAKESSVIIGTKIFQTGVNVEEITHLINARGLQSEIATLQALGRALRKHNSKDVAYIYDFLDKEKYLKKHSMSRKKHYEREGHQVTICNPITPQTKK